jgi:hypothetical protein
MRALQRLGGKFEWEEEGAVLVVHGISSLNSFSDLNVCAIWPNLYVTL